MHFFCSCNPCKMYFVILLIFSVTNRINTQTISLEYKPNRPFYHPNPGGGVGQIVPPGQPWPANAEDYANFSQTTPSPTIIVSQPSVVDRIKDETQTEPNNNNNNNNNNRPGFHPNPGSVLGQIIPPGKPWPANPENQASFSQTTAPPSVVDRIKDETPSAPTNNNRPGFHPSPGGVVGQIIPPGRPWPANPENQASFSQTAAAPPSVEDRIKDETPSAPTNNNRPGFHPNPGSVLGQIIPPGRPWPANPENQTNFNGIPLTPPQVNQPNVVDRIKDETPSAPTNNNRPGFHPSPGGVVGQIIPPGKPWPANPEGYNNFIRSTTTENLYEESTISDPSTVTTPQISTTITDDEDEDEDDDESTSTTETSKTTDATTRITDSSLYTSAIQNTVKPQIGMPKVKIIATTTTTTEQPKKITQRKKKTTEKHRAIIPNVVYPTKDKVTVKPTLSFIETRNVFKIASPKFGQRNNFGGYRGFDHISDRFGNIDPWAPPVAFNPPPLVFPPPPVPLFIPIIG